MRNALLFMLVLFTSCGVQKPLIDNVKENTEIIIKEIPRDTVIRVEADSSFYKAWIECRDGLPRITERVDTIYKTVKKVGKYIEAPRVSIQGNELTVKVKAEAQKLFAEWKERHIKEVSERTVIKIKEVERSLSWWQKFWIGFGRVLFACIVVYVLLKFTPWKSLGGLLKLLIKR